MATILVKHTVADYATWKAGFIEHGSTRKSAGSKGSQIFQSAENPNEVTVLMEWDTLENARKFTEDPGLREAMQKAGVQGRPEIRFLNGGERQAQ
jgi:heme-degrading monooxygenase HmoA